MITREMIIGDIIRNHPGSVQIFRKYNLECCHCQIADLETLEHGAGFHKIDIDALLLELNVLNSAAADI